MHNESKFTNRTHSAPDETDQIDHDAPSLRLESEMATHGSPSGWREAFRLAWERVRKQQKAYPSRRNLGQDRTKSLIILLALTAALILVFFVLFSSPTGMRQPVRENFRQHAGRGRSATLGEANDDESTVTPMLNAETAASDRASESQVTPEDVNRTSRTKQIPKPSPDNQAGERQDYALSGVDFSDSWAQKNSSASSFHVSQQVPVRAAEERNLDKPSLIFVRSSRISSSLSPAAFEMDSEILDLPPGTRLLARLEAPISSVVPTPVVAVIEYNYERDGHIAIAAGAKVLGRVAQVSSSGDVSIRFIRLEMPDGTAEKIEASAMGLNFRPLRGYVWGKKTGTKFVVRSLTGLGTVASYLIGPQASSSAGLISTNVLMRERLADNVATAGQEELNGLAFNQNIVVTVPGNTRLYVVLEKRTSTNAQTAPGEESVDTAGRVNRTIPTLEELRQLMELRREINELYSRDDGLPAAQARQQQ